MLPLDLLGYFSVALAIKQLLVGQSKQIFKTNVFMYSLQTQ